MLGLGCMGQSMHACMDPPSNDACMHAFFAPRAAARCAVRDLETGRLDQAPSAPSLQHRQQRHAGSGSGRSAGSKPRASFAAAAGGGAGGAGAGGSGGGGGVVVITPSTPQDEGGRADLRWGEDFVVHEGELLGVGAYGRVVEGTFEVGRRWRRGRSRGRRGTAGVSGSVGGRVGVRHSCMQPVAAGAVGGKRRGWGRPV